MDRLAIKNNCHSFFKFLSLEVIQVILFINLKLYIAVEIQKRGKKSIALFLVFLLFLQFKKEPLK